MSESGELRALLDRYRAYRRAEIALDDIRNWYGIFSDDPVVRAERHLNYEQRRAALAEALAAIHDPELEVEP